MSLDQPDITNQTASEFSIKRDSTHDDAQTTPPNLTVNGTRVAEKEPASNDQTKLEHGTQDIQDALEYSHGFVFVCLTLGLMAVVLVIAMDNYIISTAIPRITSDFENLNLVGWYGSSYFLTLMSFQPAFGQLCTLFPMKIVYLVSLVAFEIGSTISASAPTSIAFIVGRLVSGAAGGGLWCGTLTLMAHAVPTSKRHLYVSVVTSMYGVASAIGPILGGIFADSAELTWRFCFWINLPIGFVAFVLIAIFAKPAKPTQLALSLSLKQKIARLDILGALLLIASFICLLLALQWGGTIYPWNHSRVWGCLLGFGLLIVLFIWLQVHLKDNATIPSRIIRKRTAAAGCLFTVFMSLAIGVHVYYLPFYFQSVLGTTARRSGIDTLPYLMSLLLAPMISGALITMIGYYVPLMLIGCTLMTIGSGLLYNLDATTTEGQWIGYQFLTAFGAGICRQIAFSAVPLVLPIDDLATASALVALCNSLGPTLAISIGQSIFTNTLTQKLAYIPGLDVETVVNEGSSNLAALIPSSYLAVVRHAFLSAVTKAFTISIASGGIALICSLFMEWINVKHTP